jgi:multidrug efflux system membrane fusion protein
LLTQVRPISVVFTLPQRDLPVIAAALARGSVVVEVLDGDHGVLAAGTLQTVDNQIDVTTGTIKLKAEFANADDKLWPGQFVSARVFVDKFVDATTVPATALRRGPAGTFVYVVDEDALAAVRPVEVLLEGETQAVIGKGVEAGSLVVTVGFAQLADKRPVHIVAGEPPAQPGPKATSEEAAPEGRERPPAHGKSGAHGQHKRGEPLPSRGDGAAREAQR